jgi:cytochrome b involved in lipid metabolism
MRNKFLLSLLAVPLFLTACTSSGSGDPDVTPTPSIPTYTLAEIGAHATPDDCWMAIYGKVYNFTEYIALHPAGGAMNKACGKDGSEMYDAIPHSDYADTLFDPYYVGELAE